MTHKYALKYTIKIDNNDGKGYEPEEAKQAAAKDGDIGFADAFMLFNLVRQGGDLSICLASYDGHSRSSLNADDMFKCWVMMAKGLLEEPDIQEWQQNVCQQVLDSLREKVANDRTN